MTVTSKQHCTFCDDTLLLKDVVITYCDTCFEKLYGDENNYENPLIKDQSDSNK